MASKLISIFLGLQCWSPVLLPCPFPHRSDSNTLESTSLHTSFSWHEGVSDLVLTCTAPSECLCKQTPTYYTKMISLPRSNYVCLLFCVWNTIQKSRLTLPVSWNFLDANPSALLCLCIYLGLTHSNKDTLDLILSLSTSATCQGTEWIKPWAKARCSEAEKRPAPAGFLFLMVSLDKLGMLDTASLYSLQILTLKSIITLHSKFRRALPDSEPVSSTAVGKKKSSKGKLLQLLCCQQGLHTTKNLQFAKNPTIHKATKSLLNVFLFLYIMRHIAQFVSWKLY